MQDTAQHFQLSRRNYLLYPRNLLFLGPYGQTAKEYTRRLAERRSYLFGAESKASVSFIDYSDQSQTFSRSQAKSLDDLESLFAGRDPKFRSIFISAASSRSALNVSYEMFLLVLTHYQVTPAILDYISIFGQRHWAQRFPSTGFRAEKYLDYGSENLALNEMGRSGLGFWLCYNLRSVESSPKQEDWPWSIRPALTYQSFDTVTGCVTWITIKANNLAERRMMEYADTVHQKNSSHFDTNRNCFIETFEVHLMMVSWSSESWIWYIDFLEEEMDKLTRQMSSLPVESPQMEVTTTAQPHLIPPKRAWTSFSLAGLSIFSGRTLAENHNEQGGPFVNTSSKRDDANNRGDGLPVLAHAEADSIKQERFQLDTLQETQQLSEKISEVIQILECNTAIIDSLVAFHVRVFRSPDCPHEIASESRLAFGDFKTKVQRVRDELQSQISRAKYLSQTINERKLLLSGIVQYRNMEASRALSEKANQSAKSMESITKDMHEIASKTKQETVSMRIITLVTLLFLPGTFISTLMSTDIVRWRSEDDVVYRKTVSTDALLFYLQITLPLMLATFAAWYVVYLWISRRRGQKLSPDREAV